MACCAYGRAAAPPRLYFLLAGATARFRHLRPGLAVILAAVAAKLLLTDLYENPVWVSPAFITAVLAVLSTRDRAASARPSQPGPAAPSGYHTGRTEPAW